MADLQSEYDVRIVDNIIRCLLGSILNTDSVDVTDPESVEGKTPEEIEDAAKAKDWTERDAKTGPDKGKRYSDASGNNGIRIMVGGGNRTGPDGGVKSAGPYAQIVGVKQVGKVISLSGNGALRK